MLKKTLFFAVLALMLFACGSEPASSQTEAETETAAQEAPTYLSFGETITAEEAISYEALQSKMSSTEADSVAVKFTATVQEVCQAKGCWMTITSDEEGAEPIMVRFKDYGFFMPKDIAGRQVIMDGYAFVEETTVDELRHYAEDAGKSEAEIAAITEPEIGVRFLASGVLLLEE